MDILYKLLMNKCDEIKLEKNNQEMIRKVIEAYKRILDISNGARKEGLLTLEMMAEDLDKSDAMLAFLYSVIIMIVDGADSSFVTEIGINEIISSDFRSYDGIIALMYLRGSLMIQSGDNPRVIEKMIKSMLPPFLRSAVENKDVNDIFSNGINEDTKKIEQLCIDDVAIDENDHSLVNQTAITFVNLSDSDIQRLLRDVENKDLGLILKVIPGKARKRIFDNISTRLGGMIADNMDCLGPVRISDAEDSCVKVMKECLRLARCYEIFFDVTMLKEVLDKYDNSKK